MTTRELRRGGAVCLSAGLLAAAIALTNCGSSSATRQLTGIAVQPLSGDAIEPSGTLPFSATGSYTANPTPESVTSAAWASSNTKVATVDATTGVATCVAKGGPVTITASSANIHGTASLTCLSTANAKTGHCIYTCSSTGVCGQLSGYCSGASGPACTQSYDPVDCPSTETVNVEFTDNCGQLVDETRPCAP